MGVIGRLRSLVPWRPGMTRARRRFFRLVLGASAVGAVTGFLVALLDLALRKGADRAEAANRFVVAGLPVAGLVVATLAVRHLCPDRSSETADEYIRVFHSRAGDIGTANVPGRLLAAAATVVSGGSVGLEGP